MGLVMTSTLSAAANREASPLAIRRNAAGSHQDLSVSDSLGCTRILRLNTISMVLFIANYYATMPSAYMFALEVDTRTSQSLLSAVANLSSIVVCFIHAMMISKRHSLIKSHVIDLSFFRVPLMLSAACSIVGNILYSYSFSIKSFRLALLGRFLFGFGSSELLNRHLLGVALPHDALNREVAVSSCFDEALAIMCSF